MTQTEKKSKAGVTFTGTANGKVDESKLDPDEHTLSDHYLYGSGEDKEDYSYEVVDAEGNLRKGNVSSAHSVGARGGVSKEDLYQKLRKLNDEFDSPPLSDEQLEIESAKFAKHAEIAKVDETRNVVVGVAMEPNVVDSQGDFERPETIRNLSEGYMERLATGESQSGVMHATFPSQNTLAHVENRVLSESEEIGGREYPAGSWQIGVKVRDDTLRNLINAGALSGFSIGGHIHDADRYAADALPDDVRIDDDLRQAASESGEPIREITDATINEISLVDSPAVESAQIQTAKGEELTKANDALTDGVDTATEYLVEQRGHDAEDARELAAFLNREKAASNDESWLAKAKRFFGGESGGSGGESALQQSRAPDESAEKDGRTLSRANIASAKALHDTALDMLNRSDVDHGKGRFTDDPSDEFDVGSYGASGDGKSAETAAAESAADTDTDTIPMDEDELNDKFEALNGRLDEIEGKMDSDDEQDEEKSGNEEETDDSATDEKVEQLIENQNRMAGLLEQMADANGVSQQADTDKSDERDGNGQIESMDDLNGVLG